MGINPGEDILAAHFKGTRYYTIHPGDFVKYSGSAQDPAITSGAIKSPSNTVKMTALAAIHLPHGATITSFKVYWYRNDAAAVGEARILRNNFVGGAASQLAIADSDSSAGFHSVEDTTILTPVIDATTYNYGVFIELDPNDSTEDVLLFSAVITYTIDSPLP